MMQAGVDVYASAGTLATLGVRDGHRAKTVLGKYPCDVGTWRVTPFRAVHDAAEPLGFVLDSTATRERLLYSGDTCYIRPKVPGMTHVLIECNNDWRSIRDGDASYAEKRRIVRNHMSLETVKGFLRANDLSRLREVYLLHLSDRHSDEARFRAEVQALTGVPVYVAGG
jgi:phosphoribosyl 1,2-cyclic phosphodiesterase